MRFSGYIFDVEGTLVDSVRHNLLSLQEVEADRKRVLEAQGKLYERKYLASVKAFTGVREVFLALTREGGRIALATDCKGATLRHYLSLLAADDLIDSMACGDDVEHGKPDPRLVGLALRKLQVPAAQAVVIGDTPYDAEAASGAGTASVGVLTGGFSKEILLQAGCLSVAQEVRDLVSYLNADQPPSSEAVE